MAGSQFVALLRGINVGGRNPVRMADLRETLAAAGFDDVRTYIASGNVVLRTDRPARTLEGEIEQVLEQRFRRPLRVVVRSERRFRAVVDRAPDGFLALGDDHLRDVAFLKAPLTPSRAMAVVVLRDGVDQAWTGSGVLYLARLGAQRQRSGLSKLVGTQEYRSMSVRNWATTTTLYAMLG